jgi:hypothetical protein
MYLHAFLPLTLNEEQWLSSRLGLLNSGKYPPSTLCVRDCVRSTSGLDAVETSIWCCRESNRDTSIIRSLVTIPN